MLRRIGVTVLGGLLCVAGVILMPLPGPGFLLFVAALGVLATEYAWARRLLVIARQQAEAAQRAAVASPIRTAGSVLFALGLIVVGVLTWVVDDVPWPVLDDLLDRFWSPVSGTILALSGVVLLVTTYISLRAARGQARDGAAPHGPETGPGGAAPTRSGSTRVDPR
ncbi:MAG: PGPGW domain-containing protein [Actinomycetota bacterium]|nr:PGPGW domain-containing protein [Actinomycetota bacterium]